MLYTRDSTEPAGSWGGGVGGGRRNPLEMLDAEQGDIALETQQDSDSSDEDIADTQDTQAAQATQAAGRHRRAKASQRQRKDKM